jgi:hypothetical protein
MMTTQEASFLKLEGFIFSGCHAVDIKPLHNQLWSRSHEVIGLTNIGAPEIMEG